MKAAAGAYLLEVCVESQGKTSSRWFRPEPPSPRSVSNKLPIMDMEQGIHHHRIFGKQGRSAEPDHHGLHLPQRQHREPHDLPESALQGIHKFTIVVRTSPETVEKVVRQVEKKIDVLKTFVYRPEEVVQQEIALYKVTRSSSVEQTVRRHNVRILEIDSDYIVVEKTGHKSETQEPVPAVAALRRTAVRAQRHGGRHQVEARVC